MSLFMVASMSVVSSMHQFPGAPIEMRLAPIFGVAIWSVLLWKIWVRPHKWGLRVGIFLFLMIIFQSYLWRAGVSNPKFDTLDIDRSVTHFILLDELPIFIAGVFCTLLRFHFPNKPLGGNAKVA